MAYKELSGNIFNTSAMAVVNTVNCVGAMGKGIALDFKLRYPEMFKEYQHICSQHLLKPGQILPYRKTSPIILNFAIKDDWKDPSRIEWVEETLIKFVTNYKQIGITSVAFPWMGAMNGGIPVEIIKQLMRKYLSNLPDDIDVEIYDFDPKAPCNLFKALVDVIENKYSSTRLEEVSQIKARYWEKIFSAMATNSISSMNDICHYIVDGKRIMGKTNIERLFVFLTQYSRHSIQIPDTLF